uniref:DEK-C domain-containing protein n=1 Tax=Leersia perrieri TaxID=77586 RepID=A0A0D9VV88_9ORYZ
MDCENGAVGEDRSKMSEFKEEVLRLAALACNGEENSRTELLERFNKCNKDTLVELIRSFDMTGSKANRKEELVTKLMEFFKLHWPTTDAANLDKINEFKEETLQLSRLAFHEEEEKSRAELLEKLNKSNKDTLVELFRSFDIPGSKANKKKTKKRRRKSEGTILSGGKPLKKKKLDGSALEIHGEEEASGANCEENVTKYSECDLEDNKNECANHEKGQFPKEKTSPEPSERINDDLSEKFDEAALTEVQMLSNEQALAKTPSAKVVNTVQGDDMKTSKKKNASINKKKTTPKIDRKEKTCGKRIYREDAKPRKLAAIPSRDELRQAVFLILDSADFATMTFGDVVKEVDKYFRKDLFEKKPLIRSLIEEELFRLAEEAEKKELEEEEAAEVKARAEQAAKGRAKAGLNSGIHKAEALQVKDGRSEDAADAKNKHGNSVVKDLKGGISVKVAENINRTDAAKSSQDEHDRRNENNGGDFTGNDNAVQDANNGDHVECSRDGEAERPKKNNNGEAVEGSEDGRTEASNSGKNTDIKYDSNQNGHKSALDVDDRGAEDSHGNRNEHLSCVEDGKAQEAGNTENGENVVSHSSEDGKRKEPMETANTEQTQTNGGGDDKSGDAEHNANTEADVEGEDQQRYCKQSSDGINPVE